MAADFDQSMRNVNSIMGASESQLAKYQRQVLAMSTRFPQSAQVLSEGLYDIASSGFSGADAMKVLEESARAASAGMSDTATSSRAITAVLNAYGLEAEDAAHVSDVLFTGVDKGVMSFTELASSLGDYVGAASQLKLPLEQVVGAQAAMTLTGVSAAESATSLNNMMRSLLKPSGELTDALEEMGYATGQEALEAEGLDGLIGKLSDRVGDNKAMWVKLFPEIRAARGAMALAAGDGENLERVMGAMGDSVGRTGEAFREQAKGPAFQFQLLMNKLKRAGIELGKELIPILLNDILPAIQQAIRWWRGLSDESKSLALKLGAVAILAGPLLRVAGALAKVVGWLVRWSKIGPLAMPPTTVPVGGAPGGKGGKPPFLGGPTRALGIAAGAYALGSISTVPQKSELELIEEAARRSDQLRMSMFGVSTIQEGMTEQVRFLNAAFKEQGSETRVNADAFRYAAETCRSYESVVRELGAAFALSSDKAQAAFIPALERARFMTDKEKRGVAGLVERLYDMGGTLDENTQAMLGNVMSMGDAKAAARILQGEIKELRAELAKDNKLKVNTDPAKSAVQAFKTWVLGLDLNVRLNAQLGGLTGGMVRGVEVPHMATGGIVRRPTLAVVGEAGPEAVVPLGHRGAGVAVGGGSLRGLVIEGTLETDVGPARIRGIVREELDDEARFQRRRSA